MVMRSFTLDPHQLEQNLKKQAEKRFKWADLEPRIQKVAFDVVRFIDGSDVQGLWRIEPTPEGDVILAMYEQSEEELTKAASTKPWQVVARNGYLQIYYQDKPLASFAAAELGIPSQELYLTASYLPAKLANSKTFVQKMLGSLRPEAARQIYQTFPELL